MRDNIRMIENASRRMQRLGYLKFLVANAAKTSTSSLQALGNNLIGTMTKPVSVFPSPELADYLRVTVAGQTDKSLLQQVDESISQAKQTPVNAQLQDVYLSSKALPSQRGRLVPRDSTNYPRLAVSLGLLRKDSFAPLVRGHVLLQLVSADELRAFHEFIPHVNPLLLTQEQRFFLLFTMIENDEDILIPLFRQLLEIQEDFADYEAGNLLPAIIRNVCIRFRPRVRSGADAVRLKKLLETADVIESWKDRGYKGTGARDEAITVRLEPLVDMGLLAKDDPFAYRYRLSLAGRRIMTLLGEMENNGHTIEDQFFTNVVSAFDLTLSEFSEDADSFRFIYESYCRLKSPLGYAPIREILLLGSLLAIQDGKGFLEIDRGSQMLRTLQRQYPEKVRFNVDRMGNLTLVKFIGKPL